MSDPYVTLGISKTASADEVKQAYRKLSKEWHPDRHKGDKAAEEKFKAINEAYEIVSDPQKRARFDQFGAAGAQGMGGGGFDFSGFQQGGMGDISDLFESFFGGGRGGRRETKGADREVAVDVTLMEAVTGVKKTLRIQRLGACDRCSGSGSEDGSKRVGCTPCGGTGQVTRVAQSFFGAIQQRVVCETCRGSGTVPEKPCRSCEGTGRKAVREDITVEIPAGISEGQTLRVRGSGDKGMPGQSDGDLFVVVQVREDARFRREGDDIHTTLGVHPTDVLLGATLSVETVHGPVDIEVPAGTQPGQILRIRAKGMPALGTSRHGDHYVQIDVLIPKKLSREERRLVEEWRQAKS